jgi:cellulose synthase/poly-beta-1,6-N-acetylglucosamine synthase-like glycosyltransferase
MNSGLSEHPRPSFVKRFSTLRTYRKLVMSATISTALIFVLATTYFGYPLALLILHSLKPRRGNKAGDLVPEGLSATILVAAHNEQANILQKLRSVLLAADHSPVPVSVIMGDDGSTDDTAALAESIDDPRLSVVRCPRGGKASVLNHIIDLAQGEILILTDADPLFLPDTIDAITRPFADPAVGAVAGAVVVNQASRGTRRLAQFDGLFRHYESWLRTAESQLIGCSSADGGLFAIRRRLFPVVPHDVTDDFYISTAAVAAGHRIVFEPDARVVEESIEGSRRNFRRRVRITVRGMTGLWRRRRLMNPFFTGGYAIGLIVHKLLRRLAPLFLIMLWPLSLMAAWSAQGLALWFWLAVGSGLSLLALCGIAGLAEGIGWPRPVRMLHGLALHLAGQLTGVWQFATGRRYSQWTPAK